MTPVQAYENLKAAGISPRDVRLPGGPQQQLRQGAVVVRRADTTWEVVVEEYGQSEVLARASDEDEALSYVVARVTASLPGARPVDVGLLDRARSHMQKLVESTVQATRESPGAVVRTSLWDGAVVDRFGTLDGFLIWPEATPLAQRSLPPDALDPSMPQYGRLVLGCAEETPVLARVTAPWFGQPGGGVVFRLEPGTTVRDLVADGRMVLLDVPA